MGVKRKVASAPALQDMALFVEVARTLNFTRAAQHTGLSIATLSRRVTALERLVGVRLFERTTRSVTLTGPGQRYLARCEHLVAEARLAHEALREDVEEVAGPLRVSMPVEFGLVYVAPLVEEFALQHPGVTMALEFSPRPAQLVDDQVDVGIRLGEVRDPNLVARPLGRAARYLYAAPSYLARRGSPAAPADLAQHDCILPSYQAKASLWRLDGPTGTMEVEVHGRFSTNNVTMTLRLAELGHGLAVISPAAARAAVETGALRRVLAPWALPPIAVHAVTTSRLVPARVREFIAFLTRRLAMEAELNPPAEQTPRRR